MCLDILCCSIPEDAFIGYRVLRSDSMAAVALHLLLQLRNATIAPGPRSCRKPPILGVCILASFHACRYEFVVSFGVTPAMHAMQKKRYVQLSIPKRPTQSVTAEVDPKNNVSILRCSQLSLKAYPVVLLAVGLLLQLGLVPILSPLLLRP